MSEDSDAGSVNPGTASGNRSPGKTGVPGTPSKDEAATPTSAMTRVIFVGLLLDLLAFTLILPLFPALLEHYRQHDRGSLFPWLSSRVSAFATLCGAPAQFTPVLFGGLLGSLFSALQFLASPVVGALSDVYGRRPVLLVTTAGVAVSYAVWAVAAWTGLFSVFVLARIVGGLAKGNVSLSMAVVTDESGPKTRGRGMALVGIAFSLGFIFGPIIGAAFSVWGKQREGDGGAGSWLVYPALCALTLSLLDLVYLARAFKETLPEKSRLKSATEAWKQACLYLDPRNLFSFASLDNLTPDERKGVSTLGRAYFLYLFLYSGLEFTITFLTHLRFGFSSMQQGKMFFFVGVLMAVVQGGYVRRIPAGREHAVALRGLILIVPAYAIVGFAYSVTSLYVGLALYALSTSVCVPCMTTLVSAYGDASQKGVVMGVFRSLGALARALGPVVASTVFFVFGPEVCYCLGGLGLIVPYVILKRAAPHLKKA